MPDLDTSITLRYVKDFDGRWHREGTCRSPTQTGLDHLIANDIAATKIDAGYPRFDRLPHDAGFRILPRRESPLLALNCTAPSAHDLIARNAFHLEGAFPYGNWLFFWLIAESVNDVMDSSSDNDLREPAHNSNFLQAICTNSKNFSRICPMPWRRNVYWGDLTVDDAETDVGGDFLLAIPTGPEHIKIIIFQAKKADTLTSANISRHVKRHDRQQIDIFLDTQRIAREMFSENYRPHGGLRGSLCYYLFWNSHLTDDDLRIRPTVRPVDEVAADARTNCSVSIYKNCAELTDFIALFFNARPTAEGYIFSREDAFRLLNRLPRRPQSALALSDNKTGWSPQYWANFFKQFGYKPVVKQRGTVHKYYPKLAGCPLTVRTRTHANDHVADYDSPTP